MRAQERKYRSSAPEGSQYVCKIFAVVDETRIRHEKIIELLPPLHNKTAHQVNPAKRVTGLPRKPAHNISPRSRFANQSLSRSIPIVVMMMFPFSFALVSSREPGRTVGLDWEAEHWSIECEAVVLSDRSDRLPSRRLSEVNGCIRANICEMDDSSRGVATSSDVVRHNGLHDVLLVW